MINVFIKEIKGTWFGVVYTDNKIIATCLESSKVEAERTLLRNIPTQAEYLIVKEGSDFAEKSISMLKKISQGNEKSKTFTLATEYISEPTEKVLKVAASVPIGFVTSYGNLAKVATTSPRAVGRVMAKNPVYPIVPCHRIVGSDFTLVGYGGRKSRQALKAKFNKLLKERKGFTSEKKISTDAGELTVYPVEYVIRKAEKDLQFSHHQKKLLELQDT